MYEKGVKRALDICLCSLALVVLSPIFLIAIIGIKLSSKGSVLYHSERAGQNGRPFNFYKFRSMHVTDHDKGLFVADSDRLFFFGKIMRRTKIDELPQLLNVIKGDMSIVGPRPMPVSSVDRIYSGKYKSIKSLKPGLTSAASLYDYTVGDTYTDDKAYQREVLPIKLELELYYLHHRSFIYDVQLVWRTIVTILQVLLGKNNFKPQPELKALEVDTAHL